MGGCRDYRGGVFRIYGGRGGGYYSFHFPRLLSKILKINDILPILACKMYKNHGNNHFFYKRQIYKFWKWIWDKLTWSISMSYTVEKSFMIIRFFIYLSLFLALFYGHCIFISTWVFCMHACTSIAINTLWEEVCGVASVLYRRLQCYLGIVLYNFICLSSRQPTLYCI